MRLALRLARRGRGRVSPNPMVGAVLVRGGRVLGRGWHHHAGAPHAEIEAIHDTVARGHGTRGATLCVTLEPCCTQGRTPPCTSAILEARIRRVIVAAIDPNPAHKGRGLEILRNGGVEVRQGLLEAEATRLNEAFNHWIVNRTPFVVVKAAMTLDGKIATTSGESKWITGSRARSFSMRLRRCSDAVLVGVNTVLTDNPSLTIRSSTDADAASERRQPRRIVLDSMARTPLDARVVSDEYARLTTIVVTKAARPARVAALARQTNVTIAPTRSRGIPLRWLLEQLGSEGVTGVLVEGGGEVNASFIEQGFAHRVAFFYAPRILGGRDARKAVAGRGARAWSQVHRLSEVQWRRTGEDLFLTALVVRD